MLAYIQQSEEETSEHGECDITNAHGHMVNVKQVRYIRKIDPYKYRD